MYELDPFEPQILKMLAKGYLEIHIAHRLQMSEQALQGCMLTLIGKLRARHLAHAMVIALLQRIIQIDMDEEIRAVSLSLSGPSLAHLTAREKEICMNCVDYHKLTNEELATCLCISMNTLRQHLRKIYRKLGVKNRAGIVHFIMSNGNSNHNS